MSDVEIIIPEQVMDEIADSLVILTREIDKRDPENVAHGCLGGEHGYGAHWNNDVFTMCPFYWGDCDCGADARGDAWHAAHPHSVDCFREELQRRFAKYDEESGWNAIDADRDGNMEERVEETPFGTAFIRERTAKGEEHHKRWCAAYEAQIETHTRLTRELCIERGLKPEPYQWRCTCGIDEIAETYFATEGHYQACALVLPNFLHKRSGMEVRWYKYIGRDMEAKNAPSDIDQLTAIFRECIASLPALA